MRHIIGRSWLPIADASGALTAIARAHESRRRRRRGCAADLTFNRTSSRWRFAPRHLVPRKTVIGTEAVACASYSLGAPLNGRITPLDDGLDAQQRRRSIAVRAFQQASLDQEVTKVRRRGTRQTPLIMAAMINGVSPNGVPGVYLLKWGCRYTTRYASIGAIAGIRGNVPGRTWSDQETLAQDRIACDTRPWNPFFPPYTGLPL